MHLECKVTAALLRRQQTMFRVAERQYGLSQKIIHLETGMSVSAVGQYARGETAMSGTAIMKLAEWAEFPSDLLTVLFTGTGRVVVEELDEGDDGSFDQLHRESAHYVAEHADATAEGNITPIDRARLSNRARRVASVARKVAQ